MSISKELKDISLSLKNCGFDKEATEVDRIEESSAFPFIETKPRKLTKIQEQNRGRMYQGPKNEGAPFLEEGDVVTELSPKGEKKVVHRKKGPVEIVKPTPILSPEVVDKLNTIKQALHDKGYTKLSTKLANAMSSFNHKEASKETHTIPYIEKVYEKSDSLSDLIDNLGKLSKFYLDMSKHIESFRKYHGKKNLEDKDIVKKVRKYDSDTEHKISKLMQILNNKKK